jgi:antitoxin VapB
MHDPYPQGSPTKEARRSPGNSANSKGSAALGSEVPPSPGEQAAKREAVGALLAERGLDALLLRRVSSFAWITCGARSEINTAVEAGEAAVLLTRDHRYLLTNNIEAPRLLGEQGLREQGFEPRVHAWHEPEAALHELVRGLRTGVDRPAPELVGAVDVSQDVARLRAALTPAEAARFRALGQLCAEAMQRAVRTLVPGQTEHEIAAALARECVKSGVWPIVDLVATDQRVLELRHPLPTDKTLERYAMLVLCGRKWGLVCSVTRLVHFGPLPAELGRKAQAVARVDARFLAATRPGAVLKDILHAATAAYREVGFADEWTHHHQGGAAGYEPRELLATPRATDAVRAGQVYAWNPSIAGTKSEDSVLVTESGVDVLTAMPGWPTIDIEVDGVTYPRPDILVL